MNKKIIWKRRIGLGQSGWNGYVNGIRLFSIEMSVTRGIGWVLRTTLPVTLIRGDHTDEDDGPLKVRAEELLTAFVKLLGADWTED